MILGVGIDICQNNRIKIILSDRILSEEEKINLNGFKLESRKLEFLAGRFAVKEAIIKALSSISIEIGMRDIVVLNDNNNRPVLIKPKFEDKEILISLSHEKDYSVGFAIIESLVENDNKK